MGALRHFFCHGCHGSMRTCTKDGDEFTCTFCGETIECDECGQPWTDAHADAHEGHSRVSVACSEEAG